MSNSLIPSNIGGLNPDQLPVLLKPVESTELGPGDLEPDPSIGPHEIGFELGHVRGILRRHVSLILIVGLFGGLLSAAIAWLVPPDYTAKTQVVVEPLQPGAGTDAATVDELTIDTLISMLAARDHLLSVYASLVEETTSEDASSGSTPGSQQSAGSGSLVGSVLAWIQRRGAGRTELPEFDAFERKLRIDQERRSRVVSVRYTAKDAEKAATVANRVVSLFLDRQSERARQEFEGATAALSEKLIALDKQQQQLEETIRQRLTQEQDSATQAAVNQSALRQFTRQLTDIGQQRDNLLQQQERLRSGAQTAGQPLSILSRAHPPRIPSSLDPKLLIVPAIILSLAAGFILAILREKSDRTLRSEAHVQSALGVPCSALLPRLTWLQRKRPHEHLIKNPYSAYGEALRNIGSSLQFSGDGIDKPKVVQITSSVRGEGKTTLAISLAVFATRIKKKVLLLDLDFRDPNVMRSLKLTPEKGILDVVLAGTAIDEAVHPLPDLSIDILAMTPSVLDPVTILSSPQFADTLGELRERYDLIVIDGPPLLGVTETRMIAAQVDSILFAVKWGSTRSDVARNALKTLKSLAWTNRTIARRVRAVVTQVNLKQHARYSFGDAMELYARYGDYYNGYYRRPPKSRSKPANQHTSKEESQSQLAAE